MPAGAVRDFIPEGERITPAERQRMQLSRGSAGRPDFIPEEGHESKPPSGKEEQFQDALERSLARQEHALRQEYNTAVERIQKLNVAQTIDLIGTAPYSVMELYLAVENLHGQRKGVLEAFPPVDPNVVERYRPFLSTNPAVAAPTP